MPGVNLDICVCQKQDKTKGFGKVQAAQQDLSKRLHNLTTTRELEGQHQTRKDVGAGGTFDVVFGVSHLKTDDATSTGRFVVRFHHDWAPRGFDRVRQLVDSKFFNNVRFFRVLPNFMAQFGISGDVKEASSWRGMTIQDDPVKESNRRAYVTFATSGKNSRTTQLFINFKHNQFLDGQGFSPVGEVIEGMNEVVDRINPEYKEMPNQAKIQSEGNSYLEMKFPHLSYITEAHIRT